MKLAQSIAIATGLTVIGGLAYVMVSAPVAQADRYIAPLSSAHKQRIVASCATARASLSQLNRSDARLRFNRGQHYEFVGKKLMARLNSRLALDQLDAASELVSITARYNKALENFRSSYQSYGEKLSEVLRIDCTKQPEAFYYGVVDARERRAEVHKRAIEINGTITDFQRVFGKFSSEYQAAVKGIGNE
jgi:lipoprotein NlpI